MCFCLSILFSSQMYKIIADKDEELERGNNQIVKLQFSKPLFLSLSLSSLSFSPLACLLFYIVLLKLFQLIIDLIDIDEMLPRWATLSKKLKKSVENT